MISRHEAEQWCDEYLPGGKWVKPGEEYLVSSPLREDRNPSLAVNFGKRCYRDRGTGEEGKLSELCRLLNAPEPGREKKNTGMTDADFDAIINNAKRKQSAQDDKKALAARRLWDEAGPATDHEYLTRKDIDGGGLRQAADGVLLIPAIDILTGELAGVERIDLSEQPGRQKRHLGQKAGTFFLAGSLDADGPLLLAEGMATAASLHQLSGWAAASCFGSPQLAGGARLLRKRYPGKDIIICPDADPAGEKAAKDCSRAGFVVVALPEGSPKGADWNDVHAEQGLEAARELFRGAWQKSQECREEGRPEGASGGIKTISARTLRHSVIKAPQWAVDGLIPEGITVLAGRPKGGKSWLILQACLAVASGRPFLDHRTTQGRVLYAALEDTSYRLQSRIGKLWADDSTVPDELLATTEIPRLDDEGLAVLEGWIESNQPRMVVLDTWAKCKATGDGRLNAYEQDVRLVSGIKRIADRYGIALVLIHHLNKMKTGNENWLESLSGSMGLPGTADAILSLKRDMGADEAVLKRTGRDFEETEDLALSWGAAGWTCQGPARKKGITEERQQIIQSIIEAGEPVSPSYIAADLDKRAGNIRVLLHKMTQAGLVKRTSNNRYFVSQKDYAARIGDTSSYEDEGDVSVTVNAGNAVNGGNAGNGGNGDNAVNAGNGGGVTGVTVALPGGGNASNTSAHAGLSPSVTGVTGVTASGRLVYNPAGEFPSPRGQKTLGANDVSFPDALRWARKQPGLLKAIAERAKEKGDGGMVNAEDVFRAGVLSEYAQHLNGDTPSLADEEAPSISPEDEGAVSNHASISIQSIAEKAGVDEAAVLEEVRRWADCGRLAVGDDGEVAILEGNQYPGDEDPEDPRDDTGEDPLGGSSPDGQGGLFGGGAPGPLSEQARRFLAGQ